MLVPEPLWDLWLTLSPELLRDLPLFIIHNQHYYTPTGSLRAGLGEACFVFVLFVLFVLVCTSICHKSEKTYAMTSGLLYTLGAPHTAVLVLSTTYMHHAE